MELVKPCETRKFQWENGTTFSVVQFFMEIFQWNEPKKHVPFTTQPEFPESLGKCKMPYISEVDQARGKGNFQIKQVVQ